jgi:hypothetical protein
MHGEPMPGWRFANSPGFDGGEDDRARDTVCFEPFRPKLPHAPQPPADPPGLVRILQRQKGGDTRDESFNVLSNGLAVGAEDSFASRLW